MSIVIIEDSPTQRIKLAAELRSAGHEVVQAADGESGIAACHQLEQLPEAVITDIVMPGIDGYEVCRRLKQDPRLSTVPVIVLTNLIRPADVLRAVEAGADNYCTKPYTRADLLDRVERCIAQSRGGATDAVEVGGERFAMHGAPTRLVDILVSSLSDASSRYHEVEQSRSELERVSNQREEVMRTVVHELRSPLQAMLSAAYLAPRHAPVMADLPDLVTRQGERILRILEDLSDLTSIELGRLRIQREPRDLVELVTQAVTRLQPSLGTHRIQLVSRAQQLPALVDRDRIEQVLTNLLTNAAKYSPGAGRVDVELEEVAGAACVRVRDYGIGISADDQARVFERYFRTDRGEAEAEGLGLGLFVSRHLIEAHEGRIGVESEPDRGSTFWFEIPLSR